MASRNVPQLFLLGKASFGAPNRGMAPAPPRSTVPMGMEGDMKIATLIGVLGVAAIVLGLLLLRPATELAYLG